MGNIKESREECDAVLKLETNRDALELLKSL